MSFHSLPSVTRKPLRILIINQYFPPDTSATAKMCAAVAEALGQRHQVTVLAGRPSYDPTERHPWYLWWRTPLAKGHVTVERVGSTACDRRRARGRVLNYLSYLLLALPRALLANCNVVIAMTDPPLAGVIGALVAGLRHRPFVYYIQDLHPDMAVASGFVRAGRLTRLWERMHRWVLRQADRVVVLGEDMRERIIEKGVQRDRVTVVRSGAPLPDGVPPGHHSVAQEVRCGFPFVVLHAGNLGFAGAWEAILAAAERLAQEPVGFVFVGDGAAKADLADWANARGLRAVRFLPYFPASEVPHVLAAGDLHLVTVRPGLEGLVVPSKLYPILAAGRPVLAVAPPTSDVARIVTRSGCGVVADPDDPASVAAAIRDLARDQQRLRQMARRARAIAPEYERQKQLMRFVQLVEEAIKMQ